MTALTLAAVGVLSVDAVAGLAWLIVQAGRHVP